MDRWIGRTLWGLLAGVLSLPVLWLAILVVNALSRGYAWELMDWNRDGHTSMGEFLETGDTFEREAAVDGRRCIQIIAMKDGMPLRTDCPPH